MKTGASLNRGGSRQDYATPHDFVAAVEKRFGIINCDLAASKENTKGQIWLDEKINSLAQEWHKIKGNLWLNPPFDNIKPWAEKCALEATVGAKILFLTPASVGSNWFSNFVHRKALVLALNGRITFVGQKDPYPKDCILSCYNFGEIGFDTWNWKTKLKSK